jgi:hypothetical protein
MTSHKRQRLLTVLLCTSVLSGCSGTGKADREHSELWCIGGCKLIITDENVTITGEVEREEIRATTDVDEPTRDGSTVHDGDG